MGAGEQGYLFPPYVRESDTSEAAAIRIAPDAATLRGQAFSMIKRLGRRGATCWEVEVDLQMRHQTASARIRELALSGHLVDSGERRKTGSGSSAVVWIAKTDTPLK